MKKISGLNEQIKHFSADVDPSIKAMLPTFRKMFVEVLGASTADSGEQAIQMFKLGAKIMDAPGNDIDLEDSEASLLKDKCHKNSLRWMAHYHAQVLMKLRDKE